MNERAHQESDLRRYPAGCDREVVAAVRHFLEETGRRPEQLDEDLGLNPGTIASLAAGYLEPPGPMILRLCQWLRIPRWAFYLTGALVVGAEAGIAELGEILEKRRRQLDSNQDRITDADLAVEAVEILLAIGEDDGAYPTAASPGGLVAGVKRLGRRASRLGEPGAAVALVDLGRSLEAEAGGTTEHWDRETVEDLTRRVAALKVRIAEHEPLATTLKTLWPVIDGYFDELRRVSTALATAEDADQAPLLAQWNSQMFMLESAFAIVEEKLCGQSSARSRIEAFLESRSAATKVAKAKSERIVRDVESLKSALADVAGRDPDPELVRLLGVLEKRVVGSKETLELLSRALMAVVDRARIVFGGDRK